MIRHRYKIATLATIGVLTLGACGSDSSSSSDSIAPTASAGESSAEFNDADVIFAQGMIPHHTQAVEMATIALSPAAQAGDAVKDLATRIQGAQDPEIVLMTGWLEAWGQPMEMEGMNDAGSMDDMSSMQGMMTEEEMTSLTTLTGDAFDTAWLEMMVRHHEGAIAQAQTAKAAGSNPEALALADQIIAAQQAEITEMQTLLAS